MRLATGPVTWGVDFADEPANPPWELVLDEIAASGLDALELGPIGYLPEEPEALRHALGSRGLAAVGSFVFDDFSGVAADGDLDATVLRACRAIASAGGSVLVLLERPSPARAATAGRSDAAERLPAVAWKRMLGRFSEAAAVARDHGLVPVVHPHAGGYVEYEDEIERLLDDTDIALCLDSGHLAYAGMSPEAAITAYAPRLAHVHLKDVRAGVVAQGLDFWDAIAAGVFCPLGEGAVDVPAVLAALDAVGYEGFATIEQDRLPGSGEPLDDLRASLAVLR
jgi:inosose dehydratase